MVASEGARQAAADLAKRSTRTKSVPVRTAFVRDSDQQGAAPMARLIASGGRGGGVPVKLLIALAWASVAEPYDTAFSARAWARLLDLPDPGGRGARRISEALRKLEAERLVAVTAQPGRPPRVHLKDEGGSGADYRPPATAWSQAKDAEVKSRNTYFKVPVTLWTGGHLQPMSSAALAMLLVCLSGPGATSGRSLWWSTRIFAGQYGISPATRARGTRELVDRGLLQVSKQLVTDSPRHMAFDREQVRNVYHLQGDATLTSSTAAQAEHAARQRDRLPAPPPRITGKQWPPDDDPWASRFDDPF
ncbi:hypothetical protein [Nocardia sp. NPDC019255]|uniref:hypothetical protein n=1 Tax=Nocardia sp. NPDC019255 TaxID=3154591 RepID=UPI00340C7995